MADGFEWSSRVRPEGKKREWEREKKNPDYIHTKRALELTMRLHYALDIVSSNNLLSTAA